MKSPLHKILLPENFAHVIDILRNEDPVYGNASTDSVTTRGEEVGEEET